MTAERSAAAPGTPLDSGGPGGAGDATGHTTGQPLRRRNHLASAALLLLFLLGAVGSLVPGGRAATRGLMLLPALIAASQPAPIVLSGEPIHHVSLTVQSLGGPAFLDVYEPVGGPPPVPGAREGVVVISGVGDNRGVDQLTNLMQSLARAGLVAMEVTTPTLISYDLTPSQSDAIVQAFLTLERWPGVGAGRAGLLGLSAGGALASLAAADPRIRGSVAFLTLFGSYYDAESLLSDIGRRALLVDGQLVPWQPNEVPLVVLADALGQALPAGEAGQIAYAFQLTGFTPLSEVQLADLSPAAQAAYHLLAGDQPERVEANLAALTPAMHALLRALSPSSVVAQIRAPVYLLHDSNDEYVPFTQSRAYADALTRLAHPHDFVELTIFQHVEVRVGLGIGPLLSDGARLYRELYEMLLPSA